MHSYKKLNSGSYPIWEWNRRSDVHSRLVKYSMGKYDNCKFFVLKMYGLQLLLGTKN